MRRGSRINNHHSTKKPAEGCPTRGPLVHHLPQFHLVPEPHLSRAFPCCGAARSSLLEQPSLTTQSSQSPQTVACQYLLLSPVGQVVPHGLGRNVRKTLHV